MADQIHDKIQRLGDVGLALLVCRVAEEHCLFYAPSHPETLVQLLGEIRLTCTETLGLPPAWIDCSSQTTVDEFNEAVLVEHDDNEGEEGIPDYRNGKGLPSFSSTFHSSRERAPSKFGSVGGMLDERKIADVIVATNLDLTGESVQVQAFELIRSRRIFTRSSMHSAPKDLLFIATMSSPSARLSHHLNDVFAISHTHSEDDTFAHFDDKSAAEYVPAFSHEDIALLRDLTSRISITAELAQYIHNVAIFMRQSRYVKGGVTATATRHLRILCRALAPLHGLDFIPPSLVALAVRKIYPHRLILATAENEKTLQWGSDPAAIRKLLEGMTVEDAIEDVLSSVDAPL